MVRWQEHFPEPQQHGVTYLSIPHPPPTNSHYVNATTHFLGGGGGMNQSFQKRNVYRKVLIYIVYRFFNISPWGF